MYSNKVSYKKNLYVWVAHELTQEIFRSYLKNSIELRKNQAIFKAIWY